MNTTALDSIQFRGMKLSEWLEDMYVDAKAYMLTCDEWDPQSIQNLQTAIMHRTNKAYECLSIAKSEWSAIRRTNRRKFAELLEQAVARTGGKGQVTALKAGVEASMVNEYDQEAILEAIKEFWELQTERLAKLSEGARQLAYLESARNRLG